MATRGRLIALVFLCGCTATAAGGKGGGLVLSGVPETKHHVPNIPATPETQAPPAEAAARVDLADVTVKILAQAGRVGVEQLPPEQRTVAAVWLLAADVDNGGFDQYFFNASGDLAAFAPSAFREIGAPDVAEIVAEAVGAFGEDGPATDQTERHQQMQRLAPAKRKQWMELDARFLQHAETIPGLLRSYVASHGEELAIANAAVPL